jgi:hypothetical protein
VLAQMSLPPLGPSLDNTCTGIRKLRTMGRVSWVETQATRTAEGRSTRLQEELRFFFSEDGDKIRDENLTLEVGMKYGHVKRDRGSGDEATMVGSTD